MPNLAQTEIGIDFDRTLSTYDGWEGAGKTGEPIPLMVDTVMKLIWAGYSVVIFTARVHPDHTPEEVAEATAAIKAWCVKYIGRELPITCMKSPRMKAIYDDCAVQLIPNTGRRVDGKDGNINL